MRIKQQPFHCIECKHEWLGDVLLDAPVKACLELMLAMHCPSCRAPAKKIAFGRGDVPDPQPIVEDMTDGERRAKWLALHDNGLSSECIAEVMCGLPSQGNYPHDGQDFGRCERLLTLYPQWRARLHLMRGVNDKWDALVERWAEIVDAWRHDERLYRALPPNMPRQKRREQDWRCYKLMRSILEPLEQKGWAA